MEKLLHNKISLEKILCRFNLSVLWLNLILIVTIIWLLFSSINKVAINVSVVSYKCINLHLHKNLPQKYQDIWKNYYIIKFLWKKYYAGTHITSHASLYIRKQT
jgi:hypothetical protein